MTRFWLEFVLLISFNVFIFCDSNYKNVNGGDFMAMIDGNNQFALKILEFLDSNGNLFFSPTSISLAIGLVLLGASEETASQIRNTLKWDNLLQRERIYLGLRAVREAIDNSEQDKFELKLANKMWGQHGLQLKDEFVNNIKEYYNTDIILRDFELESEGVRNEINNWVSKQTNDKIKDFFPPGIMTSADKLVLINAIYFRGLWKYKFSEENTFQEPFYQFGNPDNGQEVAMMSLKGKFNYLYDERYGCRVLELAYDGDKASMLLVLPEELDGLSKLDVSSENLKRWTSMLVNTTVSVSLPKFQLSQKIDLKKVLPELGIKDMFDPILCNLSGISQFDKLLVSSAIHKAVIDINEKGTEASAATGIVMAKRSIDMFEIFQADHPFLFLIRHHPTNSILFVGKVLEIYNTQSTTRLTDEL